MKQILLYSLLLIAGLIGSQIIHAPAAVAVGITLATTFCLSFIMIHVGQEFEIDRARPRQYGWDAVVAVSASVLPWLFCAGYFVFMLAPRALWHHPDLYRESFLTSLFAAPTSAGVLFSMLAAAGLGATWLFKKARILAIFDDLATILLLIPLKIMLVGFRWELGVVVIIIIVLLWLSWRYLHELDWPSTWPWVMAYSAGIVGISETIHFLSKGALHIEVLLPAFALGCMLKCTPSHHPVPTTHTPDTPPLPLARTTDARVGILMSAVFMVFVGLSMPSITATAPPDGFSILRYENAPSAAVETKLHNPPWSIVALHVLAITLLSNLGKMIPALCYRREATGRERLALAVGMFPRGEVGAGVLVIALTYHFAGPALTVAVLSLALNLLLTGVFIVIVRKLLAPSHPPTQFINQKF